MSNYSYVELACISAVVVPGMLVAVGIWAYGLCKYHKSRQQGKVSNEQ